MRSIAHSMEARINGKKALLSLKMDIKMEKKVAKIANLEHATDLGAITNTKFRLHMRTIFGLD